MNTELQRKILRDALRNERYARALEEVIKPGMVIADLGSGSGLLGFLARKRGAKTCLLIEQNAHLARLSRQAAKANGLTGVKVFEADARDLSARNIEQKCDGLITETLGSFPLEENIGEILEGARHLLKPNGFVMPMSLEIHVCPVTSPRFFEELKFRDSVHSTFQISLDALQSKVFHNIYVRSFAPSDFDESHLKPQIIHSIDFNQKNQSRWKSKARWKFGTPRSIFGMALWWKARLSPSVELSTSPWEPATHWEQVYFPVFDPIGMKADEQLEFEMDVNSSYEMGVGVDWTFSAITGSRTRLTQSLDMRKGQL